MPFGASFVVEWTDRCVDYLIGGDSINVTGLAGSGRSRALQLIAKELDCSDWSILRWNPATLPSSKRVVAEAIDVLLETDKIPVLIIDDYGEIVCSRNYRWLDSMLFARVASSHVAHQEALRCVVATYPRDRRIITSDGSGLIERARPLVPQVDNGARHLAAHFGCADAGEILRLTGGNFHLLHVGGNSPNERRGNVRSTAAKWLPRWIGQLDEAHQVRLAEVIERTSPASWRSQEVDPVLAPLIVPYPLNGTLRCSVLDSLNAPEVLSLLIGQPWVYGDARKAAQRFSARCGNDESLLWVDNYLSDFAGSDWRHLVKFLEAVTNILGRDSRVDILSRDWKGPSNFVSPSTIQASLKQGGLTDALEARLRWRIYDRRRDVNLHDRQLILRSQGTVFHLPPARAVIGLERGGNDSDASIAFTNGTPALDAWKYAQVVL